MQTQDVSLTVDGLRLAGQLHIPSGDAVHPALCICHGIPAGPPDPADRGYALLAERFCRAGFVTLIFNFRGTGQSEGNLDMSGWSRDLKAALDFLHSLERVDSKRLCLLGFSGGAAVSVYTAARDPRVSLLATCACPADFRFLAQRETPAQTIERFRRIGAIREEGFPPSIEEWTQGFEMVTPLNWIDGVAPRPLLLVHGDADDVVPLEHAYMLCQKAREPRELKVIPGGGHRLRVDEAAMAYVMDWLKARCR
jgi:uncharacterized protein